MKFDYDRRAIGATHTNFGAQNNLTRAPAKDVPGQEYLVHLVLSDRGKGIHPSPMLQTTNMHLVIIRQQRGAPRGGELL